MTSSHSDVLIAGAGIAGLGLALALKQRLGALAAVTLCDPALAASPSSGRRSLRAVALAPDVRRWLDRLAIWPILAGAAQPITRMEVGDSRPGAQPNPVYLTFAADGDEPLAHMVYTSDLRSALLEACRRAGIRLEARQLRDVTMQPHGLTVLDADGDALQARLLVAADGGRSRLRHAARLQTVGHEYGQSGIVATLDHTEPHGGCAVQHFLPGGPLALLPLRADDGTERRTSIVWTERTAEAGRLVALPDADFVGELESRIGPALGTLTLVDRPQALPLRLELARRLTAGRVALLGDAARVIHPLAGQGLNLGLRDAEALAAAAGDNLELGLDPGATAVLKGYERARSFDAALMAAMTDGLNGLFSNDSLSLRAMRDFGLSLVDRAPAVKRRLIGDAGGLRAVP
jgi:2-octaprenyl-6-methoxyphenol hydroxylase